MMDEPIKILLVEDNPADARLPREALMEVREPWCQLEHVERLEAGLKKLRQAQVDAVLLDLSLPDGHGIETVVRVLDAAPSLPIVVLIGLNDDEIAIQAVRTGAASEGSTMAA